jgi:membrane protein DedA with SNARE-associated domain
MFAMRQLPFQVANAASAFIWAAWAVLAPYYGVYYKEQIYTFLQDNELLVAALLFVFALASAIPHSLFFVPAVILFAGTGFLHLLAGGDFWPLWIAGASGAFLGDFLLYRAGDHNKGALMDPWWMNGSDTDIERTRKTLATSGAASLVASKFKGVGRAYAPLVAGAMAFDYRSFAIAALASSLLWAAVLLAPRPVLSLFGW